jgi:hypothetical protein
MTRSRKTLLLALSVLTVILSACVGFELRVTNHTGGSIQFYTAHTKKAFQIASGATATVPHVSGRVIIINQGDEVWEYSTVAIPDFPSDTTKGFKRVTLPITVESNGVITLPSGRKIEPTQKMSPKK